MNSSHTTLCIAVSSIANLLQKNSTITDIGLEDNAICDGGAKMLADALKHNNTVQTLKLQGNDIQAEGTLEAINEMLRKNRDSAKERFEKEHPELKTHKLKKPPPPPPKEEKRKKKSSSGRRGSGEGRRRSKDSGAADGGGGGGGKSSSRQQQKQQDRQQPDTSASEAFLDERKKSIDGSQKSTLMDKFKGLGMKGGKGGGEGGAKSNGAVMNAAFV